MFKIEKQHDDLFCKNNNPRLCAHFYRPNVNKVDKGEHFLRYFGPIVWGTMFPEKIQSLSTSEKFKTEISGCVSR